MATQAKEQAKEQEPQRKRPSHSQDENVLIADALKNAEETLSWNIIDHYFKDNPNVLVRHHLESYNDFLSNGIARIMKDRNPILLEKDENKETGKYNSVIEIYLPVSLFSSFSRMMGFRSRTMRAMPLLIKSL